MSSCPIKCYQISNRFQNDVRIKRGLERAAVPGGGDLDFSWESSQWGEMEHTKEVVFSLCAVGTKRFVI